MRLSDIKNTQIAAAITDGLELRRQAKDMEDAASVMKTTANQLLEPLLSSLPECKVETDDYRLSLITMNRSSFDKDTAKMLLVEAGLSADTVATIWDKATKYGDPITVVKLDTIHKKG